MCRPAAASRPISTEHRKKTASFEPESLDAMERREKRVGSRLVIYRAPSTFGELGHRLRLSDARPGLHGEEVMVIDIAHFDEPRVIAIKSGEYFLRAKIAPLGSYFNSNALRLHVGTDETVFVIDEQNGLFRQCLGSLGFCLLPRDICKPLSLRRLEKPDFFKSVQQMSVSGAARWTRLSWLWIVLVLSWLGLALVIVGGPVWHNVVVAGTQPLHEVPLSVVYVLANLLLGLGLSLYATVRRCRRPPPTSEFLVTYEE